ncbi:cytochrome c3 family protein [Geobacter sp. DSM 9736]|uniref:cytochrome c3 family protein n=1 Tax=Geobacter sp. DSM 9736 TaxID=1277350 RepID=UPI000B513247|nr:cytochrome c3 family protein [Geobacter sp. DSM 9736]SNB47709.1 doubled CXXCH domain-containing protein [Geobacter sp. DSM 9736]
MKSHVWRPLWVALLFVALILGIRMLYVPSDFGIHDRGYMYGWHRKGNESEWRGLPVKYGPQGYCRQCHEEKYRELAGSFHRGIGCENCHGPALGHPKDPPTLPTDKSRELCIRCHSYLPYRGSERERIDGIDPKKHYPEAECVMCHYPHNPRPHRKGSS